MRFVSLTSSLDGLLLVCRNISDFVFFFCFLQHSWIHMITFISLIDPKGFYVESFGFSVYKIMLSMNTACFTSSFMIWICSIIILAKTSIIVLNRSGNNGYPCLALDFKSKHFRIFQC